MALVTKGFRDAKRLAEHFRKHKHECGGAKNGKDYEQQADQFVAGTPSQSCHQYVRTSGDVVRYDAVTGQFGCVSKDGRIKTYKIFTDVINGLAYYQRQLKRYP